MLTLIDQVALVLCKIEPFLHVDYLRENLRVVWLDAFVATISALDHRPDLLVADRH